MSSRIDRWLWLLVALAGCPEAQSVDAGAPPGHVVLAARSPVDAGTDAGAGDAGAAAEPVDIDAGSGPVAVAASVDGTAEVRHRGDEAWVSLVAGEAVVHGDAVRAAPDGQLVLSYDVGEIRVHGGSELELIALEPRLVRLQVTGSGDAQLPNGEVVLIAGVAVAVSRGGRVALAYDGATATASALDGVVTLQAGGRSLKLREGQYATVQGERLSKAARFPKRVQLDLSWPDQLVTNRSELTVSGRVSAGSRVAVNGKRVEVAPEGGFRATIPLKRGKQAVIVTAVDALGRRAVKARQVVMDPEAPKIKGKVVYE